MSQVHQPSTNIAILPQNPRNTQKLLAEKSLPRMRTDAHRWLGCVGFCGKIVWWLRGYGRDAIPS